MPRAARALRCRYNLVDTTRQSTTYECRLVKYALRGFEVAVPYPVAVAPVVAKVCAWADTIQARIAQPMPAMTGFELLVANFEAVNSSSKTLRRRVGVKGDYDDRVHRYPRRLDSRDEWLLAKESINTKRTWPYVVGMTLTEVSCKTQYTNTSHYTITIQSSVPPIIRFQERTPHRQDRVDTLFTGSFNPVTAAWIPEGAETYAPPPLTWADSPDYEPA